MQYSENLYREHIITRLKQDLQIKNNLAVPKLTKITLNIGADVNTNKKHDLENYIKELTLISGQKPVITKARKSISSFKIRTGFPIGVKVTLRGRKMYEFLDRLIHVTMPRIRDFKGIPHYSFDDHGNCSIGIRDHTCFAEIDFDKVARIHGLDVCFTTTAVNIAQCQALMRAFQLPINEQIKKPKARQRNNNR